ncbi:uncharacterized protein AB9X84_009236 [Acanthopagrus schlegelii]
MKMRLVQALLLMVVILALVNVASTATSWTTPGPHGLNLNGKMFTLSLNRGGISFFPPSWPSTPSSTTSPYYSTTKRSYSTTKHPYTTTRHHHTTTKRSYSTTKHPYTTTRHHHTTTKRSYSTTKHPYTTTRHHHTTTKRSYSTTKHPYTTTRHHHTTTKRSYSTTTTRPHTTTTRSYSTTNYPNTTTTRPHTTTTHPHTTTKRSYSTTKHPYTTTRHHHTTTKRSYSTTKHPATTTRHHHTTTKRSYSTTTKRSYSTTTMRPHTTTMHSYSTTNYPNTPTTRPHTTTTHSYSTTNYPNTTTTRPHTTTTRPHTTTTTAPSVRGVSVCLRYLTDFGQTSNPRIFTLSPSGTPLQVNVNQFGYYTLKLQPYDPYGYNTLYMKPSIKLWSNIGPDIWSRVCFTLDSMKNVAQVFSGSNISIRMVLPYQYVWSGEPVIEFPGFDGQLTDVQMWDYPLSYREVFKYMNNGVYGPYRGSVLTWSSINYTPRGNTLLEDVYEWQTKQQISGRRRGRRPKGGRKNRKFVNVVEREEGVRNLL